MKIILTCIVATSSLAAQPVFAQRGDPVNSLARARTTFTATDADKDQKLTFEELQKQRLDIQRGDFEAMDADKNGTWSSEEFLVYYRRLLLNSSRRPAADLEAEVTRIQALRKAREADSGAKNGTQQPKTDAPLSPNGEDRLALAIDDLEKKAVARQATRAEFQHVRDALVDHARIVSAKDPAAAADLQNRFGAALTALEAKAKDGNYTREEFNGLRAMLIEHARDAAGNPAGTPIANANDVETKLQAAIDDLEKKAAQRQATRADFDRVRDALTARARLAQGQDATEAADIKAQFDAALAALEIQAKQGHYSREEYAALRNTLVRRGREAAQGGPAPVTDAAATAPNATDVEGRLQRALDDLARKADARQATRADFDQVRDAWTARAKAAMSGADPAALAQQSALADRFSRAMDELEQEAAKGNWSRAKFDAVRESYVKRARAASGTAAVPEAAPPAAQPEADVAKRFDAAVDALEQRALARGATREDFQKVRDMMAQRARLAVTGADGTSPADANDPHVAALAAKLNETLNRLEQAAQAGTVTREDFAALRQMYVTRAREAASNDQDGKGPAAGRGAKTPDQPKPTEPPKPADTSRGGREKPAPAPPKNEPPKDEPKGGRPAPPPHRG